MTLNIIRKTTDINNLIGSINETPATEPTTVGGLHSIIAGFWADFRARIPNLINGAVPVITSGNTATSITLATINVTTTNAVLFASNTNRIFWTVEYKSGTGDAYITEGTVATAANGKIITIDTERLQDVMFTGIINVIGTVASGTSACTLGTTEYNK